MKLICIVLLLTFISACYGAVYRGAGCPNGYKDGNTWNPPGCKECHCRGTSHVCYSCGVIGIGDIDRTQCYTERNGAVKYPKCCEEKVFCVGQPGFDAAKLK